MVGAERSADDLLGWPYLLTEQLAGASLLDVVDVDVGDHASSDAIMEAVGAHLAQMYAIRFDNPGYVMGGAPGPLEPDA